MVERVNLNFSGFRPDIIEKVIRLLLILERIGNHAFLGSRMSLHGGTALNLFVLAMPRLSVDIDLSYVGNTDREQMLAERPAIEHAIADIARELGFTVTISPAEHSGRTFRLQYKGTAGLDSVKIDTNFLNRSPLLPLQRKTVVLDSGADAAPWHPGVPSQAVGCPSTQEIAAARPRSTRLEVPALLGTSLIDRSRADRRNPGQILQAPLRLHLDPPKAEKIGHSQGYQRLD